MLSENLDNPSLAQTGRKELELQRFLRQLFAFMALSSTLLHGEAPQVSAVALSESAKEALVKAGFDRIIPSSNGATFLRESDGTMMEILFYPTPSDANAQFDALGEELQEVDSGEQGARLKRRELQDQRTDKWVLLHRNWMISVAGRLVDLESLTLLKNIRAWMVSGDIVWDTLEDDQGEQMIEIETIFGHQGEVSVKDVLAARKPAGRPDMSAERAEALAKFKAMPPVISRLYEGFNPQAVKLRSHDGTPNLFRAEDPCEILSVSGDRHLSIVLTVYEDEKTAQRELERTASPSSITKDMSFGSLGHGSLVSMTAGNHVAKFRCGVIKCYVSGLFADRDALLERVKTIQELIETEGSDQLLEKWKNALPPVAID